MTNSVPATSRILLVEDEPANRALVRAIISRSRDSRLAVESFEEAPTIADARTILGDHDVDVVLLDVRLPDGNGLDLAAELRASGNPARIIIVSASVLPLERSRALESGADDFLGKPFGAAELIEVLVNPGEATPARHNGRGG